MFAALLAPVVAPAVAALVPAPAAAPKAADMFDYYIALQNKLKEIDYMPKSQKMGVFVNRSVYMPLHSSSYAKATGGFNILPPV